MKKSLNLIFWEVIDKMLDKIIDILRFLHIMKPLPKIDMPDEPVATRNGKNLCIGDCSLKILKETKYNIILYNEVNNNLIITDNHNKEIDDITEIFWDVRFYSLYYKIMTSSNLAIVIRSDEGLTNDYHVFENIDVKNMIANNISFKSVFKTLSSKESYFLW